MKKENLKSIALIGILVLFSLSVTYAFLTLSATNTTSTGKAGCFQVNYSGQEINNSALKSSTTYSEGAVSEVVLSKAPDCNIYTEADILINTTTTTAPISNGALKYRVEQGGNLVSGGEGAITATGSIKLATVPLTTTATTYKIYIWIDSSLSNGTYNDKTYNGYIYARSTQTSTLK